MKKYYLDGRKMTTKEETHKYIKDACEFPGYYGNNLDALNDVLQSIASETVVIFEHVDSMIGYLGGYGESVVGIFELANKENNYISIIIR